jgi:hypothetical protein
VDLSLNLKRLSLPSQRFLQTDCRHTAIQKARSKPDIDIRGSTVGNVAVNSGAAGLAIV